MTKRIGKKASDKEMNSFRESGQKGIVDFRGSRIILPEDFYNPKGPHNLHWDELARIEREDVYGSNRNRFGMIFNDLLQDLTKRGLMSEGSPQKGDYYMVNVGGITVALQCKESGPWGKQYTDETYYPRVLADAEEYVKHFHGGACYPIYIAQIVRKDIQ